MPVSEIATKSLSPYPDTPIVREVNTLRLHSEQRPIHPSVARTKKEDNTGTNPTISNDQEPLLFYP